MSERKYFDGDQLIRKMYHKIAVWHNNDEKLNDQELGSELKLLCQVLAEDVLKAVHGDEAVMNIDKKKLGMTDAEIEKDQLERTERRADIVQKIEEANKTDETE